MPHALTKRQKEYLAYIKDYIREREESPSLKEIAEHFRVKPPTAHNILDALQQKDFIYFLRHSKGFIIRLVERGGMAETIFPLFIVGSINQYGELIDLLDVPDHFMFPRHDKQAATDLPESITIIQKCADPHSIFGLRASQNIPQAKIEKGDILVIDAQKMPQAGFMSLLPVGPEGRQFLCWSYGKTHDDRFFSFDIREPYPLPEQFVDWDLGQRMFWKPIAWDDKTDKYFIQLSEIGGFPTAPIPMNLIGATVLELIRDYS